MPPVDDPMRPLWQCNNNIVCSWLLNSISKDLTASVIYSNTAAAIWQDLENRFKQQNGPRLFQLRKALTNCAQGSSSVTQYFTKLKSIWEELSEFTPEHTCTCNGVQPLLDHIQREYVLTFLMGLNDSYSQLRGQILVMKPIPSITECFSLLVQEEKQREVSGVAATPESQLAFAIQALVNANVKAKGGKTKDRPIYSHCSLVGYTKEKCYKIIGYPPGYQKGKSVNNVETVAAQSEHSEATLNTQQHQQLVAYIQAQMAKSTAASSNQDEDTVIGMSYFVSSNSWIVDSGASSHITHSLQVFSSYKTLQNQFVILPNNTKIPVSAIGTVHLAHDLILENVLYIPSFHVNLLSVGCLLHNSNCSVMFTDKHFLIQDIKKQKVIGKGDLIQGLYVYHTVLSSPSCSNTVALCTPVNNTATVWHNRLGHLSDHILKIVGNKIDFPFPSNFSSKSCRICPLAKFQKLPFIAHNNYTASSFDLIH